MNPTSPTGVVLDHTALLALASGHRELSRLVVAAHLPVPSVHVLVPTTCIAAAEAHRVGIADHVASMHAPTVVDFALSHAMLVGRLLTRGVDWPVAHAVAVARPDAEFPQGHPVMTATRAAYQGFDVVTIAV